MEQDKNKTIAWFEEVTKDKVENRRIKLWCDVAIAYANSTTAAHAHHKEYAAEWADRILEDFDKRFKLET